MATLYERYKLYRISSLNELRALLDLHEARGGTFQDLHIGGTIPEDEKGYRTVEISIRKFPKGKLLTEKERETKLIEA